MTFFYLLSIFRVSKAYSHVFEGSPYEEFHFNKMEELDCVSRFSGEDQHY